MTFRRYKYFVSVSWKEDGITMGHMFSMYAIPITYEMAFKIAQILYPNKEALTVSVSEEK